MFKLPPLDKEAVSLPHFPTLHQAFIFRAAEYVPAKKIAEVLKTTEENVKKAISDMGLPNYDPKDKWLKKGYITIIRRMWHILPYNQLIKLLDTDEQTLAKLLREEDFLNIKLGDKPVCSEVRWRELTKEEKQKTARIKEIVSKISVSGAKPFDFSFNVPEVKFSGAERFKTRMIYAFSGLYQHAFDVDSTTYLSDETLLAYQKLGINGIWTQGILTNLAPFPFDPTVSEGFKKRLSFMRKLTERLEKYGIKLYLYINEPRSLPLSFFEKHPELKGHIEGDGACLCTSKPAVQRYIKEAVAHVCREVRLLGGFFAITRSENLTNCHSHTVFGEECNCPTCKGKSVGEVVSGVIKCFADGAHSVDPDVKVFAWSWGWEENSEEIIKRLPNDVILLTQSELDVPFEIGGIKGNVLDYSMGNIGPGERAKKEWTLAKECGLQTAAKIQVNTTWEASTVPAIPVLPLVEEHIRGIESEGVRHLMLSWTLGGYPSENLVAAARYFYENCEIQKDNKNPEAVRQFSLAFKEFPFYVHTLYNGPHNAGPSNLLFEKPTGYKATMTCFAYDDLESWRGIYPVDVFENQFEKLCNEWEKGLSLLNDTECETAVMAKAAYCLFKSSLNQIRFISAREKGNKAVMTQLAKSEMALAKDMLSLMNKNAAIGYEAANHYYFSKGQLVEKIINCDYILTKK